MASVSVNSAVKHYGTVKVLHSVSMDIADGEFVVLVGPSGCGKTTLLRMIAGLESITGGTISIGGMTVNDLAPKDRDIAMVFQNYALYPHMTAGENMAFSMSVRGASKSAIKQKIEKAAKILGLEDYLDRHPRELSGGQRQRVAMGRAIVRDPKVFLFDEPLSNLDAKLRGQMRAEIKSLMQQLNATTVYVTHDQIEAMTMADRIVVMRNGVVEQIGSPLEVYDKPASLFVAGFIGSPSMNMLRGQVEIGASTDFVMEDGGRLPLDPRHAEFAGAELVLGSRPENIKISDAGLEVTVDVVEPTGSETLLSVKRGELNLTVLLRERTEVRRGDKIRLAVDGNAVHFFDPSSEKALTI